MIELPLRRGKPSISVKSDVPCRRQRIDEGPAFERCQERAGVVPGEDAASGSVRAHFLRRRRQASVVIRGTAGKNQRRLRNLRVEGKRTKLYQALYNALKKGPKDDPHTRQIIVVVSDGKDEGSDVTLEQVITESKATLVPIYAVFRGEIERSFADVLAGLANAAGGTFFPPEIGTKSDRPRTDLSIGNELPGGALRLSGGPCWRRDGERRDRTATAGRNRLASQISRKDPGALYCADAVSAVSIRALANRLPIGRPLGGGALWVWRRVREKESRALYRPPKKSRRIANRNSTPAHSSTTSNYGNRPIREG